MFVLIFLLLLVSGSGQDGMATSKTPLAGSNVLDTRMKGESGNPTPHCVAAPGMMILGSGVVADGHHSYYESLGKSVPARLRGSVETLPFWLPLFVLSLPIDMWSLCIWQRTYKLFFCLNLRPNSGHPVESVIGRRVCGGTKHRSSHS